MLIRMCRDAGAHTDYLKKVPGKSGHTIIQVDKNGQNSILLFGGVNRSQSKEDADRTISHFGKGDMYDYQMFKGSFKGFDKEEVLTYVQKQEEDYNKQISDLEKEIKNRDKMILELKARIAQKDEQRALLEDEIEKKYKKYIDNYDKIGALVYESQVKGDKMIADAKVQADKILADANAEARTKVDSVQSEVDAKLADGKQKYLAVQDVMDKAGEIQENLKKAGLLVKIDDSDRSPGWKFSDQEMRGFPMRIEIGPKDIEKDQCVLVRRDTREKSVVRLEDAADASVKLLDTIQKDMFERARKFRDEHINEAENYEDFKKTVEEKPGFVKAYWCGDQACEDKIKEDTQATSRCMSCIRKQSMRKERI